MLQVDLHSHSLFSRCGIHTVIEMLSAAKARGMAGLAITDHGPELDSWVNSPFYERLMDPVPGIRLVKGIEANFRGLDGEIDVPMDWVKWMDLVLLGIHPNTPKGRGRDVYTRLVVTAIERYACVDIITHPTETEYPVDLDAVAHAAAARGVALELNNSRIQLSRTGDEVARELLHACVRARCRIAVCSDAHALNEIGCDDAAQRTIEAAAFPRELIVNRDAVAAFSFVGERRAGKR